MQRPRFKSTLRLFTVSLSPTVSVFFSLSHQIKAWITQSHYFIFKLHLSYPFFLLCLTSVDLEKVETTYSFTLQTQCFVLWFIVASYLPTIFWKKMYAGYFVSVRDGEPEGFKVMSRVREYKYRTPTTKLSRCCATWWDEIIWCQKTVLFQSLSSVLTGNHLH